MKVEIGKKRNDRKMKVEFKLSEKDKSIFEQDIKEITECAKQNGFKITEFGIYEGIVSEQNMDNLCFFILLKDDFLRHCLHLYFYPDKENRYKEDFIKTMKMVRKRNYLNENF